MSRIILPHPISRDGAKLNTPLPDDYGELAMRADIAIRELSAPYPRTAQMYEMLISDRRVDAHWNLSNYTTVGKLNYNDHGPIHARVTASYAMQIMQLLIEANVPMDVVKSGAGNVDDACLVALAGVMLHDIGNATHRVGHELMSVILAQPILADMLAELYDDDEQRALIGDFILSAIQCHDMNPPPLFMEGSVVAVADGCDMTKGRARMPFDLGKLDIHAVSALAIEEVNIRPSNGSKMPVEIEVRMSNSAGIFQVEETLVKKINATPLRHYVMVHVTSINPEQHFEKRILSNAMLENGRLKPV
ncbi:MAG: phosphohydrolase [Anaerolineae bacterium]|nr:phosphohydrolase [Candidatus Roseilinea sp.]MDW8451674.1 phosphohydrolase [Anaerolineae bacterium]